MVVNAVCFIVGICCLVNLGVLPGNLSLAVLTLVTVAVARKSTPVLFLALGFVVASLSASSTYSKSIPAEFLNKEVLITGSVAGLPQDNGIRLRFLLTIDSVTDIESSNTVQLDRALVRLNWYGRSPPLKTADKIQLRVKLKRPSGFMNPGGFDYEKWLFQQRIVATGYVRNKNADGIAINDTESDFSLATQSQRIRGWLQHRLLRATQGLPNSGLILALAVGDRSGIDRQQWDRFIATGTNHLLAISGLHITLVAGFAGLVARAGWAKFACLQQVSKNNFALFVAATAALCYAAMAGFSLPTQRALIMFGVLVLLVLLRRHQQRQSAMATALIVVALVNPLAVMSVGFWMSFAAVAILFLVFSFVPQTDWRSRLVTIIRGHVMITIGLYPLTLLVFEKASIIAPLANFVAVPVVGMVLTPLVFAGSMVAFVSVTGAAWIFMPVDWVLSIVDWFFALLSQLPMAIVHFGGLSNGVVALTLVAAITALLPIKKNLRWIAVVLVLPLTFSESRSPAAGAYRVTFLDVGQGTAVVVQTKNHTLVYDTGPQFSASFNAADAVIIPFLRSQRISTVDVLIVSHGDNDHSGGADELVAGINVQVALASAPLEQLPEAYDCRSGQQWRWDNVSFRILHPQGSDQGSENDLSCVLLISTKGGKHTLLPGDIEQKGESRLLEQNLPLIDVLMAPHHGSNTSSGVAFVGATLPDYVVYTTGFANRYGFPKKAVSDRYQFVGTKEFNTATSGAVSFEVTDAQPIAVREYRYEASGFWGRHNHPLSGGTATLN